MSESLIFAILGFLVACLFGTVVASFLWRRAVSVTKRSISEDENFASLEEVASLKADLREQQSALSTSTRDIKSKEAEIASLKEAQTQAETDKQATTEKLREELRSAGTALETAIKERETAQAALQTEQDATKERLAKKEAEVSQATGRITFLETSIRTLVSDATAVLSPPPLASETPQVTPTQTPTTQAASSGTMPDEKPEEPATAPEQMPIEGSSEATVDSHTHQVNSETNPEPAMVVSKTASDDDAEETDETALDITRSLEERIEALKQGQTTH